ncbi:MAG: glutathione S-transferase family protein [Psychrobium sp.]
MITVHHLNNSRSQRIIWLLEELKLPYDVVHHQRDPVSQLAPQSLKDVHPLAKAPVLINGDITLVESGAMIEYLLDQQDSHSLRPTKSDANYYDYLQWLHFAEGSLSLPVITSLLLGFEKRSGDQAIDGYIAKELALDLSFIDAQLTAYPFFAGNSFSAADIMMTFLLESADKQALLAPYPSIVKYLSKIQQRSAYQESLKLG